MLATIFGSMDCCCGKSKAQLADESLRLEDLERMELQRLEEQDKIKTRRGPTFFQQVGKSACCGGQKVQRRRRSLSLAPPVDGAVLRAPAIVDACRDPFSSMSGPVVTGPPPHFSGSYTCVSYEGNMDEFLMDLGASWTMRSLASGMGYGVGIQKVQLTHIGDELTMDFSGGRAFTQRFRIGGGKQETSSAAGPIQVTPFWDGRALRTNISEGEVNKSSRWMYFEGDDMILHSITCARGTTVKHRYKAMIQ